ncbi:SET and MYND domain-containing protein 4 [Bulinus truncatus]|nr:SET and MYND domain-containing protein 4 [Bulinus truncatus]
MAAPTGFGNWQQSIDNVCRVVENTTDFKLFRSLQSNKERVDFIFRNRLLKHVHWLPTYFEACKVWHGKSPEVSKVWRNKGNKYFQLKQYAEAIEAYTQSCLNAPVGENLTLAYGNRSAALYHLDLYKECLLDINRAMESGFPSESLHKLLSRKTNAHLRLEQIEQAEKKDFLKEVDLLASQVYSRRDNRVVKQSELNGVSPAIYAGVNDVVLQASKAVTLCVTPEKGRHLIANRFIPKGSTIIVERPFAAVLLPDHYENHCHHCFSKLPLTSVGCTHCNCVRFCHESCREKSWNSYHKTECHYLDLLHSVGIAHLSLRIILCAQLPFLRDFCLHQSKYRLNDDSLSKGLNQNGQYDRSYVTVYDLMTHDVSTEPLDMLQYTLTAALLLTTLIHSGVFDDVGSSGDGKSVTQSLVSLALGQVNKQDTSVKLPADILDVGDLLLRHILQLVCNAHAITGLQAFTKSDDDLQTLDTEQVRIATAIYPTASLMNHSCDPTIISSFIGETLVVRTVKDVKNSEEIFNCYGPHYCRMRREERQEVLNSQYHFDCNCSKCSAGDFCNDRFAAFKCPSCGGVLLPEGNCTNCGQAVSKQTLGGLKKKLDSTQVLFTQGVHLMSESHFDDAIRILTDCFRQREKILYKDHRDIALVQDVIARCYASIGDFSQSADHLLASISFAQQMYGDKSVEYSHELLKMAEVLFNAERFSECLNVSEKCLALFSSLYPQGHENIKQVTELRDATQLALAPMMEAHHQK